MMVQRGKRSILQTPLEAFITGQRTSSVTVPPICTQRCLHQQLTHQEYHWKNLRAQTLYSLMVQNSITSSPFHRVRPKIAMLIAFWHPSYRTQPADVHPTAARHTCPCSMILRDRMMGKQRWTEWFVLLCLIQFTLPFRERVCLHLFYLCKSLTYPVLEERTNWILLPEDSPDLWQALWVHNSNLSVC